MRKSKYFIFHLVTQAGASVVLRMQSVKVNGPEMREDTTDATSFQSSHRWLLFPSIRAFST